jgi:hypothetical protein
MANRFDRRAIERVVAARLETCASLTAASVPIVTHASGE